MHPRKQQHLEVGKAKNRFNPRASEGTRPGGTLISASCDPVRLPAYRAAVEQLCIAVSHYEGPDLFQQR